MKQKSQESDNNNKKGKYYEAVFGGYYDMFSKSTLKGARRKNVAWA